MGGAERRVRERLQQRLLPVGERVQYCAGGYQAVGWVGLKGGFESGCNSGYYRLESGFTTVLAVTKRLDGWG